MKIIILSLALLIILPTFVFSADLTFRNGVKWDMSQKQIKKLEADNRIMATTDQYELNIQISSKINDLNVFINYSFLNNGKLAAIDYMFIDFEYDQGFDKTYKAYENIKDTLIEKYGEPQKNELSKDLMPGYTKGYIQWLLNDTEILLSFTGNKDNNIADISLYYYNLKYKATLKAEQEARKEAIKFSNF